MKRLTANTRTVIKSNYALITEDSYVGSVFPGWENVEIRVVISPAMGANLSQYIIQLNEDSQIVDTTIDAQIFFYLIEGTCAITIGEKTRKLTQGGYAYIPIGQKYSLQGAFAKIVAFQKKYELLANHPIPDVFIGNEKDIPSTLFLEDPQLHMQYLLPDTLAMDFAVNIFRYNPGGNLPMVESHIMEHGLLYLQGEGIYRLNDDWYHICKGDVIWMAPYCPQWFTAMGKEDAVYIYCKNVNRKG